MYEWKLFTGLCLFCGCSVRIQRQGIKYRQLLGDWDSAVDRADIMMFSEGWKKLMHMEYNMKVQSQTTWVIASLASQKNAQLTKVKHLVDLTSFFYCKTFDTNDASARTQTEKKMRTLVASEMTNFIRESAKQNKKGDNEA